MSEHFSLSIREFTLRSCILFRFNSLAVPMSIVSSIDVAQNLPLLMQLTQDWTYDLKVEGEFR